MPDTITFDEALSISSQLNKRHLLTGNGFSIACRKNIFRYDSLFEQANFESLDPNIVKIFEILNTKDFEIVMKHLKYTADVLRVYAPDNTPLINKIKTDANQLKSVLVNAIANSHPVNPNEITDEEYAHCKKFLRNFSAIYTLNYDLLLYWTFMKFQNKENGLNSDDGFRTPDYGKADFVSWDIEKTDGQNLFYLHGALHIFDAGSELQKYTWINTGVKLIDQIQESLDSGKFPLFVSEGTSLEKVDKIMHSNYLSRGLRSFSHIGGSLFIFGHSLAQNDSHILNLIHKSKIKMLFVSIFGNVDSLINKEIIKQAETIIRRRSEKNKLQIFFYNAESAKVWG